MRRRGLASQAAWSPVRYSGLSSSDVYQINLTIPANLGTGDVPLVAIGGNTDALGVVMSLQ